VEAAFYLSQKISGVQCQNAHIIGHFRRHIVPPFSSTFGQFPSGVSRHLDLFMDLFRRFKCSQEIDRYMALGAFGLWQQSTNPFVSMARDWCAKDFFTFITYSSIAHNGDLNMMCSAGVRNLHKTAEWPSWVPDYSPEGIANRPLLPYGYHNSGFNASGRWAIPPSVREVTRGPWCVSHLKAKYPLTSDRVIQRAILDMLYSRRDERLVKTGKRISCVQKVHGRYDTRATSHESGVNADRATILHWFSEVKKSQPTSSPCRLRSDFSRMLVADGMMRLWYMERQFTPDVSEKMFSTLVQSWENEKNNINSSQVQKCYSLMKDFLEEINECCRGLCLFILENGSYGLCPPETTDGDIVCLLLGGKAPFVLRPTQYQGGKGYFNLIGDCYVNGIMSGEAANWWEIWTERFYLV
jgi:hypothetical protein